MKLLIYSDLHTEFALFTIPASAHQEADVIVFAGDIGVGHVDLHELMPEENRYSFDLSKPTIYTPGNHEYYDRSELLIAKKWQSPFCQVIDGVRFLSTTLWTNMHLRDNRAELIYSEALNDFRRIKYNNARFTARDWLDEHNRAMLMLSAHLRADREIPTVIVSHHAPHENSTDARWGKHHDGYYASDLEGFILEYKPVAWIHGHVHKSNDYMVGDTRIISNPRGYVGQAAHENATFNPNLIIEV